MTYFPFNTTAGDVNAHKAPVNEVRLSMRIQKNLLEPYNWVYLKHQTPDGALE